MNTPFSPLNGLKAKKRQLADHKTTRLPKRKLSLISSVVKENVLHTVSKCDNNVAQKAGIIKTEGDAAEQLETPVGLCSKHHFTEFQIFLQANRRFYKKRAVSRDPRNLQGTITRL